LRNYIAREKETLPMTFYHLYHYGIIEGAVWEPPKPFSQLAAHIISCFIDSDLGHGGQANNLYTLSFFPLSPQ
jgi:hypothetical protein